MCITPSRIRFVLLVLLILAVPALSAEPSVDDAAYDKAIHASVLVVLPKEAGAGCFIDADNRLFLTNYHVVEEADEVQVVFPRYDHGRLIDDRDWYWKYVNRLATTGHVIVRDKTRDLALIQVDRVPATERPLDFAAKPVEPGASVYRVGSPAAKDESWNFTKGVVKQVRTRALRYHSGQYVLCRWVESDAPPVKGHSGSAVLNADGELIGVHAAGVDATNLSAAVEESVVKEFVEEGKAKLGLADAK